MAALANEYNIYTLSLFNWWAQSCLILKTRNSFLAYVLQLKSPNWKPRGCWVYWADRTTLEWGVAPLALGCYSEGFQESKTFLFEVTGDLLSRGHRQREHIIHHSPFPWCFRLHGLGRAPGCTVLDEEVEGKCCVRGDPGVLSPGTVEKEETEEKEVVWGGRKEERCPTCISGHFPRAEVECCVWIDHFSC